MIENIVIIGAGQAGIQAAATLRSNAYEGKILLISDEEELPYQKPPLSKEYLTGKIEEKNVLLKSSRFYERRNIDLALGEQVVAIDTENKFVETNENKFAYDKLIIASGASNRQLNMPNANAKGVYYLRSLEDAKALKNALTSAQKIAIIGGGFIGLEIAASAIEKGINVSVIEMQEHLMQRVLPSELSTIFESKHSSKGVRLHLNSGVNSIEAENGMVKSITLSNHQIIEVDALIIGIGVMPNLSFVNTDVIQCSNGIDVNEFMQTSQPDIYAIGDVAYHENKYMDDTLRLESIQNAMDQGKIAAQHIMGSDEHYDFVPWFWTNQFELKLQMAGSNQNFDHHIIRGALSEEKFTIFYFKNGKLIGADSVNAAADHMAARKLIQEGITPREEELLDMDVKLKNLIPR